MPSVPLKPFWQTSDRSTARLYCGDVIDVLRRLPSGIVQTVVTSPPYWGLRSYLDNGHADKSKEVGSEQTPAEYVEKMVAVFREIRRVLRDDGTVWLNLGDSYGSPPGRNDSGRSGVDGFTGSKGKYCSEAIIQEGSTKARLKSGNLVGIPWRVALALQDAGWILRQDIIWSKPAPMPESVRNRCTKAHEYVFLFAKKSGYYYDAEAIKEKATHGDGSSVGPRNYSSDTGEKREHGSGTIVPDRVDRNKRSVWVVNSEAYPGAHFATFPRKLIEPCVLAGTSEYGACAKCGAPWKRIVEREALTRPRPNDYVKRTGQEGTGNSCPNSAAGVDVKTLGREPTCKCDCSDVVPCLVLDPFCGSGTTNVVSLSHGRRSIGIDLSAAYLRDNAVPRITGALLSRPSLAYLVGSRVEAVEAGEEV